MQRHSRARIRGFTLVELMMVVLVVGVLAALASTSYRKQVNASKAAEARAMLAAIRKGVVTSANREWMSGSVLAVGSGSALESSDTQQTGNGNGNGKGNGATVTHGTSAQLCGAANTVPSSTNSIKGRKYQSSETEWATGDKNNGWICLGFSITGPQYFQYGYELGGAKVTVDLPHGGTPPGLAQDKTWTGWARGDLDGDGKYSWYVMEGGIIGTTVFVPPAIDIQDDGE